MHQALSLLPALLLALPLALTAQPRGDASPVSALPHHPPAVQREVRAVWVATVNNMDWPSRPGLSTREQQSELLAILDRAAALRMNTIVFQVRPEADALYRSPLEPWSRYLTGEQGRAPDPAWDPLEFAVREAHRRGLELHAWFNPYRVAFEKSRPRSSRHVSRARPDLVVEYGQFLWMDPALPEVRRLMIRVITDVVRRYDIDGVHIDDYFYPYPQISGGRRLEFPDARTYRAYQRGGGQLSLADWRRSNVDVLVREFYDAVKREKRWVKVGISPFGIWRPGHPATTTAGLDQYDELYADVRKWLHEGSLDYLAPQLYWPTRPPEQSYPVLLDWWVRESVQGRHIWPGLALYKLPIAGPRRMTAAEIVEQIEITRRTPKAEGHILFNARVLMENVDGIADRLVSTYAEPAIAPAFPWLDSVPPRAPSIRLDAAGRERVLHLAAAPDERVWLWVLQWRSAAGWRTALLPGAERSHILGDDQAAADLVAVSAVDRTGNMSQPTFLRRDGLRSR
jgi:uncharacterized lipoprotein YddW (UPF0748 family)